MLDKASGFRLDFKFRPVWPSGNRFAFASLLVLLLVIYGNSFSGAWQYDDIANIVENDRVHLDLLSWSSIRGTFTFIGKVQRPLAYLTFGLNHRFGGLDVFGYHAVNLAIHYLSAVLLYLFLYHTLRLPLLRDRYGSCAAAVALLAATLWASHPLQVTAVTYIVQRMASLAAMLALAAMLCYVKGRTAGGGRKAWAWYAGCGLATVLACASKENSVLLPLNLVLYDLLLIQGATRENLKKNAPLLVLTVLAPVALGVALNGGPSRLLSGYRLRPFTLGQRLLTEPRVLFIYLSLLCYPASTRLMLVHDVEASRSLLSPWTTLPALVGLAALAGGALLLARRRPLVAYAVLFFLVNHLVEGTVIPLELIYEHRNYLPSMMLFAALAAAFLDGVDHFAYKPWLQWAAALTLALLIAAQGHTTWLRNDLFRDPYRLWLDNVAKAPGLSRPHIWLAQTLHQRGRHLLAMSELQTALDLGRYSRLEHEGVIHHLMGNWYLEFARNGLRAEKHYRQALEYLPDVPEVQTVLAMALLQQGRLAEAHRYSEQAVASAPGRARYRNCLALVLLKEGNLEKAVVEGRRALQLKGDSEPALALLGEAYRQLGEIDTSIYYWLRYLKLKPRNTDAHLALIELYRRSGRKRLLVATVVRLVDLIGRDRLDRLWLVPCDNRPLSAYGPDPDFLRPVIAATLRDLARAAALKGSTPSHGVAGQAPSQ